MTNLSREALLDRADSRVRARLTRVVYSHLRKAWAGVFRLAREIHKQGGSDAKFNWEDWQHEFNAAMLLALMWGAGEFGTAEAMYFRSLDRELEPDAQGIFSRYEVQAEARLQDVLSGTRKYAELGLALWLPGEDLSDLSNELSRWFSRARAQAIADTEGAELMSAAAGWSFERVGVNRWMWIHIGEDTPCARFCLERVDRVFRVGDRMPPVHPNDHCRARPLLDG